MKKYLSFFRLRFVNGIQYQAAALAGIVTQFAWGFLEIAAFRAFPLLIIALLLPEPYGLVIPKDPAILIWFFFTLLMAFCIVVAFCMLIYISTFFTISSQGIRMVSTTMVEFFAGAVIPLPFFPDNVRRIFELLPFGSMQNVPFLIFNGYAKGSQIHRMAVLQVFWLVALVVLGKLLAHIALKKVVVQGG